MPPKKIQNYSEEALKNAMRDIKDGIPLATVSKTYNIPRTTLYYKKTGKYPELGKIGSPTVLSSNEETALVSWMLHLSDTGFPATKTQLLDSIEMILKKLKRDSKFSNNRPGRHWYELFLKRHPEIAERITQNLTSGRAKVSEQNIRSWFKEVTDYFKSKDLLKIANDPTRVFNADEAAFFLSPKGSTVLARKGQKSVYSFIANDEKECLTTLVCGNAAGAIAPPMTIYPYERIPMAVVHMLPKGYCLGKSESGWMTSQTFFEYITNSFYPWLVENEYTFPILLFVDGHASHLTLPLSEFCTKNKIELIALYPNSTHILQPMDVAIFHPLKTAWRKAIHKWRIENGGAKLKRENFAPLFNSVLRSNIQSETLKNGFRVCGLCPLNADAVDYSKIKQFSSQSKDVASQNTVPVFSVQEIYTILNYMDSSIEPDKLKLFKNSGPSWQGNVEDTYLFNFWYKVKLEKEQRLACSEDKGETASSSEYEPIWNLTDNDESIPFLNDEELINAAENMENYLIDITHSLSEKNITGKDYVLNDEAQAHQVKDETFTEINRKYIDMELDEYELPGIENVISENKGNTKINVYNEAEIIRNVEKTPEDCNITSENKKNRNKINFDKEAEVIEKIPEECNVLRENKENRNEINLAKKTEVIQVMEKTPEEPTTPINHLNVPTPFKKCLFWPDTPKTADAKRVLKDKIPTVATSEQWQTYFKKKESEKKQKEVEKQERKKKREENKMKRKDKSQNKNASKENPGAKFASSVSEEQKITNSDVGCKKVFNDIVENSYVIVKYDSNYYPGKVTKSSNEGYMVSAYEASGPFLYKWPKCKDEILYAPGDIVELISEPVPVQRGCFKIKEMKKYKESF